MYCIRQGMFETNSSSCHTVTGEVFGSYLTEAKFIIKLESDEMNSEREEELKKYIEDGLKLSALAPKVNSIELTQASHEDYSYEYTAIIKAFWKFDARLIEVSYYRSYDTDEYVSGINPKINDSKDITEFVVNSQDEKAENINFNIIKIELLDKIDIFNESCNPYRDSNEHIINSIKRRSRKDQEEW